MDAHLRELERRFTESGGLDEETAYLRERLRIGDLSDARFEIAYLCDHPAARAIGAERPRLKPKLTAFVFEVTTGSLNQWGKKGCPRKPAGRSFTYDLAEVLAWRASLEPKHVSSRGRDETIAGNLTRCCGYWEPISVFRAGAALLGALAATGSRRAAPAREALERWIAEPNRETRSACSAIATSLSQASFFSGNAVVGEVCDVVRRFGLDFDAELGTPEVNTPLYWVDGKGHLQLDFMGRAVDKGVRVVTASREGRIPKVPDREDDRRVVAAIAAELVPWALSLPGPR